MVVHPANLYCSSHTPIVSHFARTTQIHLMELPNPDPLEGRPDHGGRDRHLAFTVRSIEPLLQRLQQHDRPYTMSKSGRRAVFTRDLDANAFEFLEADF